MGFNKCENLGCNLKNKKSVCCTHKHFKTTLSQGLVLQKVHSN